MTASEQEIDVLLELDRVDRAHWRGRARAAYGGRAFGGHLLAHAIRASSATQAAGRPVNSLHAHFLSAGRSGIDIDYRITNLKPGRSLTVDHVVVGRADRPLAVCTISYHAPEPSNCFQVAMPAVPTPSVLKPVAYIPPGTQPSVREPFELRYTDHRFRDENGPDDQPSLNTWIRARGPVRSSTQADHAALLAYAVDFLVTRVAHMPVRGDAALVGASLDHAMWFHRPFRVDEWLLVSCVASTLAGARSLSRAEVFDEDGRLVATAVQEALLRGEHVVGARRAAGLGSAHPHPDRQTNVGYTER